METTRGLIIIPTYNERENIREITRKLLAVAPSADILVVDDNSPDGTADIVAALQAETSRVKLLKRPEKLGLGSAYIAGFQYALREKHDWVMEIDADFSHDPDDVPRFLELIQHHYFVLGSRYKDGVSVVNWPITRLILSYFANLYARTVTGVPVHDLTSGFKCVRREVLEKIPLDKISSDGYAFQIELHFLADINGFKIVEIPIIFTERRAGSSKMSKKIVWEAFWLVWKLRWHRMWKKPRR